MDEIERDNMKKPFLHLDTRHKLAVGGALVTWGVSVWFSKEGFVVDTTKAQFLGWILAIVVTIVELVFNSKTQRLSLTLIAAGVVCYIYGLYTNMIGFWEYQHPGVPFIWNNSKSIISIFVGTLLEILPEPLFMWGIGSNMEGDLLGNLIGLISGYLDYAKPVENTVSTAGTANPPWNQKQSQPHNQHQSKVKTKLASPIFNQEYTNRFKNDGTSRHHR